MSPEDISGPQHPIGSCSADVAAYALGALRPQEADSFRLHLESCAVCPVELDAFRQVVDDLAISVPQIEAPRDLRRRVMRAVEQESAAPVVPERRRARPRLSLPRPAFVASGGLALAAVVAAIVVLVSSGTGPRERVIAAQVTGHGRAALQVSHDGHAQLVLHHFPAPQYGGIYEVWLKRGDAAPTPTTALFSPNRHGDASVDVPGSLHGVTQVLVTPEPAGGTLHPTHTPVITAEL